MARSTALRAAALALMVSMASGFLAQGPMTGGVARMRLSGRTRATPSLRQALPRSQRVPALFMQAQEVEKEEEEEKKVDEVQEEKKEEVDFDKQDAEWKAMLAESEVMLAAAQKEKEVAKQEFLDYEKSVKPEVDEALELLQKASLKKTQWGWVPVYDWDAKVKDAQTKLAEANGRIESFRRSSIVKIADAEADIKAATAKQEEGYAKKFSAMKERRAYRDGLAKELLPAAQNALKQAETAYMSQKTDVAKRILAENEDMFEQIGVFPDSKASAMSLPGRLYDLKKSINTGTPYRSGQLSGTQFIVLGQPMEEGTAPVPEADNVEVGGLAVGIVGLAAAAYFLFVPGAIPDLKIPDSPTPSANAPAQDTKAVTAPAPAGTPSPFPQAAPAPADPASAEAGAKAAAEKQAAEAKQAEEKEIAAEKEKAEKAAADKAAAEKKAAEAKAAAEKQAEENKAAEAKQAEEKRIAAQKAEKEKAEKQAADDKAAAERKAAEAQQAEEKRIAAEKAAAEKAEAEKAAAEKKAAEAKAAAEKKAADAKLTEEQRAAAEKAAAEKAAQEKAAAEARRAEEQRIAAEKAAAEKAEQEKAAAEAAKKEAEAKAAAEAKAKAEEAARIQAEKEAALKKLEEERAAKSAAARESYLKAKAEAEAQAKSQEEARAKKAEEARIAAKASYEKAKKEEDERVAKVERMRAESRASYERARKEQEGNKNTWAAYKAQQEKKPEPVPEQVEIKRLDFSNPETQKYTGGVVGAASLYLIYASVTAPGRAAKATADAVAEAKKMAETPEPGAGTVKIGSRRVGTMGGGAPSPQKGAAAPAPAPAPQQEQRSGGFFGFGGGGNAATPAAAPVSSGNLAAVKAKIGSSPQEALKTFEMVEQEARKAWQTAKDRDEKAEALKLLRLAERNTMLARDAIRGIQNAQ